MIDTEELARQLHEAGREAVLAGDTVAHAVYGERGRRFIEWDDLPPEAQEGRRSQARNLAAVYSIYKEREGDEYAKVTKEVADALQVIQNAGFSVTLQPRQLDVRIGTLELYAPSDRRAVNSQNVTCQINGMDAQCWLSAIDVRVAINEIVTAKIVLDAIP